MHTLNGDPNVSKLQQYTIELYKEIEAELGSGLLASTSPAASCWPTPASGWTGCAWPRPGAGTSAWTWRSSRRRRPRTIFPLMEEQYFVGALFDPVEGTSTRPA